MRQPPTVIALFFLVVLLGCGGKGGADTGGTTGSAPVTFSIQWPVRSRALNAPSSALSAVLDVIGGGASGADVSTEVDRDPGLGAYTKSYISTTSVAFGAHTVQIKFYDALGGTGDVVASASAGANFAQGVSDVGNIALTNTVAAVTVNAVTPLAVSQTHQLTFTASDSKGNIVAVSLGSGVWTQLDGTSVLALTAQGVATAVSAGVAHVSVSLDGLTSFPVAVMVSVPNTPVRYSVSWGARSRGIQGPSSALSAVLTLTGANPSGGDFVTKIDRVLSPQEYTQSYTSTTPANQGTFPLLVQFYDDAGGVGDVVGTAHANVTIASDGTGIGSVTVVNTITSVSVDPNQTVLSGYTKQLTFSARDGQGNLIPVTLGSGTWAQLDGAGAISVSSDGIATGIASGTSHVHVVVDGITSEVAGVAVPIPVDFQNPSFETPALPVDTAQSPGDPTSTWMGNSVWGIANGSTAWGIRGHTSPQYAFLQASTITGAQGELEQTLSGLTIGQRYQMSFWIARRNGTSGANTGTSLSVYSNGTPILVGTSPLSDGSWIPKTTATFVASQTSYLVDFKPDMPGPNEDTADLLDDVHLQAVP